MKKRLITSQAPCPGLLWGPVCRGVSGKAATARTEFTTSYMGDRAPRRRFASQTKVCKAQQAGQGGEKRLSCMHHIVERCNVPLITGIAKGTTLADTHAKHQFRCSAQLAWAPMAEFLELLDALRATRDADSCLRGLNLFRKGLRGEEGPAFLARYLRQSPDWQELQHVWDTQLTVSAGWPCFRYCRHFTKGPTVSCWRPTFWLRIVSSATMRMRCRSSTTM